jgi:hypothetical protein
MVGVHEILMPEGGKTEASIFVIPQCRRYLGESPSFARNAKQGWGPPLLEVYLREQVGGRKKRAQRARQEDATQV